MPQWTVPKCTTVAEAEEMRQKARKVLADKYLSKDIEKKRGVWQNVSHKKKKTKIKKK